MKNFLKEFKDFIATGNLIELAVAFIMAAAVGVVINSFVNDIMMQIIAAIFGKPDFSDLSFKIGKGKILYGNFINAVVALLIVGLVLFMIVKAYNRMKKAKPEDTTPSDEVVLLTEIRDALRGRQG